MRTGAEPPPASLGTNPGSAPTSFVASPVITRTFSFSCGFLCKFRRKHISCRFCQGFKCLGEVIPYDFRFRRKCEIIRRKKVTFCDKFFAQTL